MRVCDTEAVALFQEARIYAERLSTETCDQRVCTLVVLQAESLYALGHLQDGMELLRQEQNRLERLQNPTLAGPYYFRLGLLYNTLGKRELAHQSAQCALAAAEQCDDKVTMGKTCYVLSRECIDRGQYRQAIAYGQQGVALLERTAEKYWLGMAYVAQASSYGYLGEMNLSLQAAERASALGDAIEHRLLQSRARSGIARCHTQMKAWEAAIAACQGAIAVAPDAVSRITALNQLGDVYLYQRDHARALPVFEEALRQAEQSGHPVLRGNAQVGLSEACILSGDIERARGLARQAMELSRETQLWNIVGRSPACPGSHCTSRGGYVGGETVLH